MHLHHRETEISKGISYWKYYCYDYELLPFICILNYLLLSINI